MPDAIGDVSKQPAPAMLELYAGDVFLGSYTVHDDQDIADIVNTCPVMLTHYMVALAH